MAAEGRRDAAPLKELLVENIERFEFAQALRLLERMSPDRAPVGGDHALDEEVVRFRSDISLVFPRSDLQRFEPGEDGHPPLEQAQRLRELETLDVLDQQLP